MPQKLVITRLNLVVPVRILNDEAELIIMLELCNGTLMLIIRI